MKAHAVYSMLKLRILNRDGVNCMGRNYWLDLFTGKTWEEFIKSGAKVSGFKETRKRLVEKIQIGDYLICYITGISRFIGILEVKSKLFYDMSPIWEDDVFPYRVNVVLIYTLEALTAVPVIELKSKLSILKDLKSTNSCFFRVSPSKFEENDGIEIVNAIKSSVISPTYKEYNDKKYMRRPKVYVTKGDIVTVPEESELDIAEQTKKETNQEIIEVETTHDEIQWLLLNLGSQMGLDVWVAKNDKNKKYNGNKFQDIKNIRNDLPRQFDDATNKTIEMIDVIWLQGDAFIAAFEVEHTTAIYSGLLRMSDLVSMQPNIKIDLYIVAPDERRYKVFSEINRPTFAKLKSPLPKICKFIPYSELKQKLQEFKNVLHCLKPEFIEEIAESCEQV